MTIRGFVCLVVLLAGRAALGQQNGSAPEPHPPGAAQAQASKDPPAAPDLTPGADGKLSQAQMQDLFRIVAGKDDLNQKLERDYTYVDHEVHNKLDGKGQNKSTEVKTYEILEIYGEQVRRLIAKDDKPLEGKDARKEDEKIQKIIDKRKNESE